MDQERWKAVDNYLSSLLIPEDPALNAALRAPQETGLPPINVSPIQGQFLHLLARLGKARNILELGTLAGYSTIWLARALPEGGRLITLEIDPRTAAIAQSNIDLAGLSSKVEIRLGAALDTLPQLVSEVPDGFDFIFIDAGTPNSGGKQDNPEYFKWALKLSHPGTLIVVDNVISGGKVIEADSENPGVQGARGLFELMSKEPRLSPAVLQTVGSKGHDGFALAFVT